MPFNLFQSQALVIVLSSALLLTVAAVDSATGPDVYLSIFYLLPGALVAWSAGRKAGILFGIASSIVWLVVELGFGKRYRHVLVPYTNGFLQLIMSLVSTYLIAAIREREKAVQAETAGRKKAEMDLVLERALADAIETEQQRLGKDLHDGLGQHLVSTGFVASMLKTKLEEKGLPEAKDAEELTALVSDAIGQSRQLARGLFPVKLEAEGLLSALHELVDNITFRSRVDCQFQSDVTAHITDPNLNLNLYRIAQEAITNALKHASPRRILVQLRQDKTQLALSIENDGKVYSPDAQTKNGIGLRVMEHRARQIGGTLTLDVSALGGTRVLCTLGCAQMP